MNYRTVLSAILLVACPLWARGQVRIEAPLEEAITDENVLTLSGTAVPGQPVQVKCFDVTAPPGPGTRVTPDSQGKWTLNALPLPRTGIYLLIAEQGGVADAQVVSRRPSGLLKRPRQLVRFVWDHGSEKTVRDMLTNTLNGLQPADADGLVFLVQGKVRQLVQDLYSPYDIEFLPDGHPGGAGVTTVHMDGVGLMSDFGYTKNGVDLGNVRPEDECTVFLQMFHQCLMGQLEHEPEADCGWTELIRPTDDRMARVDDLAHCIARTASHELGHALGLVMNGGWMGGIDSHPDPGMNDSFAGLINSSLTPGTRLPRIATVRWQEGRYVMDTNMRDDVRSYLVFAHHRMGLPKPTRTGEVFPRLASQSRIPPEFNLMNRYYLTLIHPR